MSTGTICVTCKLNVLGPSDLCNQTLCWCTDITDKEKLLDCGKETGHIKVINFFFSAFISNPVSTLEIEDSNKTRRSAFFQTTTFSGDAFDERSIKIEVPPHQGSRSAMGQFKVVMHAASSGQWKETNLKVNWMLVFHINHCLGQHVVQERRPMFDHNNPK